MERFEVMKLWVPLDVDLFEEANTTFMRPINSKKSEDMWSQASKLAHEGWELVGAIPIIIGIRERTLSSGAGASFTDGYFLLFKRKIQ